jgi:hypothetical protein
MSGNLGALISLENLILGGLFQYTPFVQNVKYSDPTSCSLAAYAKALDLKKI